MLDVVQAGPFQGLREEPAQGGQQGAFVVGEASAAGEGDHAHADGVPGGQHGQERPRLLRGRVSHMPQ